MTELEITISDDLLKKVMRKYHYHEEDMEELRQVADVLEGVLKGRSGFWCRLPGTGKPQMQKTAEEHETAEEQGNSELQETMFVQVVMTLGAGVDELQNYYVDEEAFCECYMVETMGNELLLECYVEFNEWVARQSGWHVARYHFFGSREDMPLEGMKEVLEHYRDTAVACNDAYCLIPKMSVIFLAELTRDDQQICEGICMGCGNRTCPNRMGGMEEQRWPNVPQRTLPYGYARILEHPGSRQ